MRNKFFIGSYDLSAEQRREARRIAITAKAKHGTVVVAAKEIGISIGTFSRLTTGEGAGKHVYAVLKAYEARMATPS